MSVSATGGEVAMKLMQERLSGTESDVKDLAKMLLDLGISPTTPQWTKTDCIASDIDMHDENDSPKQGSDLDERPPGKSVRFYNKHILEGQNMQKPSHHQPILKKSAIKPLKLNMNSSNHNSSDVKKGITAEQYSKLVTRLCKTESKIQSLKLSICSLQTSHQAADHEKNIVIDKLKQEIAEQENIMKKQQEDIAEERKNQEEHARRWEEAEKEVKELHQRLQLQATMTKENSSSEELIREKFSRKIEEVKQEAAREKEVRVVIEDSHLSLLSRVQDMEDAIQHERMQTESLKDENKKLRETNEILRMESNDFNIKAKKMEETLSAFKDELDSKEKAIRRLIEEQHQYQTSSSSLVNEQASLSKELKQCNIVLEVQKAAFAQLEAENEKLKRELEETRMSCLEKEQEETRKQEEELVRRGEQEAKRREFEGKLRGEMNLAVKLERKRLREAEERNKLLEECVKEQEKVLKVREQEMNEREKGQDEMLFEEKKKTVKALKEKEQAIKAKENLMRDLTRASTDVAREKEFLQQQLEELKLEQEVVVKERSQLEEENQRLLSRVASVEEQEQAYKRAQELASAANTAKNQLAYENGKLQTRVEQLEEELRAVASVQSQVVQLRAANRALEQKYSQLSSELATSKVDFQRTNAHIKQLQNGLSRKESDFNLAISARDEAVREKEAAEAQINVLKEQEKNKLSLLKRDLTDCRSDNDRLTATVNDISSRYAEVEDALKSAQVQLGRKDSRLSTLNDEREKLERQLNELSAVVSNLQSALNQRDADEQARITPALNALERARQENDRLSKALDDSMQKNDKLKEELDRHKTDLEIQRERVDMLLRQKDSSEKDSELTSQSHAERLQQMKEQFERERSAIRKQLQQQVSELKNSHDNCQMRNSQLTKGNTDLRSKIAEREQTLSKLKEKLKQQKSVIDRLQRERTTHANTEQKIKAIDSDLKELENSKQNYIEKNKQQREVITTFNHEVSSLKDDITALSEAHKVARETNMKLESEVERHRSEKQVLKDKLQSMEEAVKKALHEKKSAEAKLRKVEIESVHVQENLQEAQTWFKDKFERLQGELSRKKVH